MTTPYSGSSRAGRPAVGRCGRRPARFAQGQAAAAGRQAAGARIGAWRRAPAEPAAAAQAPAAPSAAPAAAGRRRRRPPRPARRPRRRRSRAAPARLPPAGSPPLVRFIELAFPTQGDVSVIDPQTYLYYIQTAAEPLVADGCGCRTTERDRPRGLQAPLGHQLPRQPVDRGQGRRRTRTASSASSSSTTWRSGSASRSSTTPASKQLEQTKIDEKLKEENVTIRLDSFIDPAMIKKVKGIVRDMLAEKGYQFAEVTHEIKPMPGGPKLVHLTFDMNEGPKVKIRELDFVGNKAVSDGKLKKQMKNNKAQWRAGSVHHGSGTYQEDKFEEDADKVTEYYREPRLHRGARRRPRAEDLEDSKDGKTRCVSCASRCTEGARYQRRHLQVRRQQGHQGRGPAAAVQAKKGEFYNEKLIRKGLETAREVYGTGGYFEFTGYPGPAAPRPRGSECARGPEAERARQGAGRVADRRRRRCGCRKASSTSSTASPSSATRRRATT